MLNPSTICSKPQAKRFFAVLCYAGKNLGAFEKQLEGLPEEDWSIVLLASTIIENCGISQIKDDFVRASISEREYWVPVPNQHLLQDQAWVVPVLQACDPDNRTFRDTNHGVHLFAKLSEKLDINLKTKDTVVFVDLRHCLSLMSQLLSQPELLDMSQPELDSLMSDLLTNDIFCIVRQHECHRQWLPNIHSYDPLSADESDDLFKGIMTLAFMIALFVTTGLIFGYYCNNTNTIAVGI